MLDDVPNRGGEVLRKRGHQVTPGAKRRCTGSFRRVLRWSLPVAVALTAIALGLAAAGGVDAAIAAGTPEGIGLERWLWMRWAVSLLVALAVAGVYFATARKLWPRRRLVRVLPIVILGALALGPVGWAGLRAAVSDPQPLPRVDLTAVTRLDVAVVARGRAPAAPIPPPLPDRTGWDTRWSVVLLDSGRRVVLDGDPNRESVAQALTGARDDGTSRIHWRSGARHVLILDPYPIPAIAGGGGIEPPRGEAPAAPDDFAQRAAALAPTDAQVFVVLRPGAPSSVEERWRRWAAETHRGGVLTLGSQGAEALADVGFRSAVTTPQDADDVALAWRLRPRLYFHSRADEREGAGYMPVNVDDFIATRRPWLCRLGAPREECTRIEAAAEIDGSYAYLDAYVSEFNPAGEPATARSGMPSSNPSQLPPDPPTAAACSAPPPGIPPPPSCAQESPLYWHVRRHGDEIYVGYWWFFPFNPTPVFRRSTCRPFAGIPERTCFDHASDWEGVTVVARRGGGSELVAVIFEQHGVMLRRSAPWLRAHGALDRRDGRPRVYIAAGSHSSYPERCRAAVCSQAPLHRERPEGPHDGGLPWPNNGPGCQWFCLLRLPVTAENDPAVWNAFPGRWGRRVCIWWDAVCSQTSAPKSPGLTDRFLAPWLASTQ